MENNILNLFYMQVLLESVSGYTEYEGNFFGSGFQTRIEDPALDAEENHFLKSLSKYYTEENSNTNFPTLVIRNLETFNNFLVTYVTKALEFLETNPVLYKASALMEDFKEDLEGQIVYILANVWSTATPTEFADPIPFLQKRISFFDDALNKEYLEDFETGEIVHLNQSKIQGKIVPQDLSMETPFLFQSKIIRGEEEYPLPGISYGIANGVCAIYAIQGDKHATYSSPEYKKEIHRLLYRVNDHLDTKDASWLQDVPPSSLLAATTFLKALKQVGIEQVEVVSYHEQMWKNKSGILDMITSKVQMMSDYGMKEKIWDNVHQMLGGLYQEPTEEEKDDPRKVRESFEQWQEKTQVNMTNKLIYTFYRVEEQTGSIQLVSDSFDSHDPFRFRLKEKGIEEVKENPLLAEIGQTNIKSKNSGIKK